MKRFIGFVRKEFYHIFRDPRTLLILFGMPVVQILLFGFAVTNEIREARIAILDPAPDAVTREITQKLLSSGYFLLEARLHDATEIEAAFRRGEIKQVVVFEAGFARKLQREGQAMVQVVSDGTDPNTAQTLLSYTSGIIQGYQREQRVAAGGSGSLPLQIEVAPRMRYNPEQKGVFLFVPGLITIILMLVSAMMTSISITREKEMGTMEVLLASPMQPAQVILGKVTPYVFLALVNAVSILLLGKYVFGVPVVGSIALLMAESLLFIIASLSLGILISTIAKTQQVALLISLMGLMLPVILLSGFLFPIENMPLPLQLISNIIPARWFIIIVKAIMLKGSGLALIWKETLILLGFTLFFLAVSVRKFKVRLE
ncbi:MAG: ABC transporter permease [Bacteroidetes bacterium]|nr:MAG: ABC transporter permease [Bacteroidota bacterium]